MNQQPRRFDRRKLTMASAALTPFGAVPFSAIPVPGAVAARAANQATPPAQSDVLLTSDLPMVFVNGAGSMSVPPDIATLMVGVEVERQTLAAAQAEAATRTKAILAALRASGIASADIQTAAFTVRVVRERARDEAAVATPANGQRRAITGFQVSNDFRVTVRDLTALGQILDDALAAGANEVRGLEFATVDPTGAVGRARAAAMADARAKADALATAAGMTIGGVRSITETLSPYPVYATASAGGGEDIMVISIGTEEVQVEVQVVYALA